MATITLDDAVLRALQRRAESMARGELCDMGHEIGALSAVEDLRRAIDVLGAHTEQGLRHQHAYIAALSTAQEAERSRLARELHDEVVQQLIALGHSVDRVGRLVERDPVEAAERLRNIRGNLTSLVSDLRAIIGDLRPPALDELGLLPAVELLLRTSDDNGPQVSISVQGDERRLAPQSELALFRIIQEAWNNIRRHAQARHMALGFAYAAHGLRVTITDDGVGFAPPRNDETPDGHWGVRGMRERAELTGGTLALQSAPDQGTTITIHIPYPGVDGRDPVCGMTVEPDAIGAEYDGTLYRFCSPACRDLFLAQPQHYVSPTP